MHEHDRREDTYVYDEADQLLGGELRRRRQSIGHIVEGWKDRRENDARSEASPVCLNAEAGSS